MYTLLVKITLIKNRCLVSDCPVSSVLCGGVSERSKINLLTSEDLNSHWRWEAMSRLIYFAGQLGKVWVSSESLPGFKTMLCFSFSFPFTVLATINLQSQHELQLLTNFLLSVQVSLAQGQLPVLLGMSVESPRVKWSLCQEVCSAVRYLQLYPGLRDGERRTLGSLSLSSHSRSSALRLSTPVAPVLPRPQAGKQCRSVAVSPRWCCID